MPVSQVWSRKGKGVRPSPAVPKANPAQPRQRVRIPEGRAAFWEEGGPGTSGACTWALGATALQLPGHVLAWGATEVSSAVGSALRRTSNPSPDLWPLTRPCPITRDSDVQGKRRRTERKQADLCHPNVHVFKPEFPVPQTGDCI